jgi:hypothetical protein
MGAHLPAPGARDRPGSQESFISELGEHAGLPGSPLSERLVAKSHGTDGR